MYICKFCTKKSYRLVTDLRPDWSCCCWFRSKHQTTIRVQSKSLFSEFCQEAAAASLRLPADFFFFETSNTQMTFNKPKQMLQELIADKISSATKTAHRSNVPHTSSSILDSTGVACHCLL